MKVRFQADADFSQRIVSAVRRREPAIDFQSASVLNLRGLDDSEVLALAAQSRVLVSHALSSSSQWQLHDQLTRRQRALELIR